MMNDKVSSFFFSQNETVNINNRIKLLDNVLGEIRGNEGWMRLCGGKVWKWFYVDLWRNILVDNGLSDEGKTKVMRLCVLEKVKYNNMGVKTLRRFLQNSIVEVKKGEKISKNGMKMRDDDGESTAEVAVSGTDDAKVAA
jgi:hypothetical protein